MKKSTFLVAALLAAFATSYGQHLYLRTGLGFTIPSAGQTNDGNGLPYNGTLGNANNIQSYKIANSSFSAGLPINVTLGYMFTKSIGVELNASYNFLVSEYSFKASNVSIGGIASDYTVKQAGKSPLFLSPSLVVQTDAKDLNVYARFGLVLPLNSTVTQHQIFTNLPGTGAIYTDDLTFEIKNSFSLGFAAAAGVKYKIGGNKHLWAELGFMSLSVLTKQSTLVSYVENGQSIDLAYVQGNKVVNYSKTAQVDTIGAQQPTYSLPFSNVGLHAGITFDLGDNRSKGKNDVKGRRKKF